MAADAFEKLKSSFNRGITTISVKTSSSLEKSKIKTHIESLTRDIERDIQQIGETAYKIWSDEEKDFTAVDNTIEILNLKPRDREVLDCFMAGMNCMEIAEFLDISRITVWRRRTRAQEKYKTLFH